MNNPLVRQDNLIITKCPPLVYRALTLLGYGTIPYNEEVQEKLDRGESIGGGEARVHPRNEPLPFFYDTTDTRMEGAFKAFIEERISVHVISTPQYTLKVDCDHTTKREAIMSITFLKKHIEKYEWLVDALRGEEETRKEDLKFNCELKVHNLIDPNKDMGLVMEDLYLTEIHLHPVIGETDKEVLELVFKGTSRLNPSPLGRDESLSYTQSCN